MTKADSPFRGTTRCCFALLALAIAGCQATNALPTLGDESAAKVADGSVVFGKISVVGGDGPMRWEGFTCQEVFTFDCPDVFRVYVFEKGADEPFSHMLSGDGAFYWVLRPGEYKIAGFKLEHYDGARFAYALTGRIAGQFVVPSGKPSVYVGTTDVFLTGGRYATDVRDEFDHAKSELDEQTGSPRGEAHKSLVLLDRVPDEEKAVAICSGDWGIACTKKYRGVRVLSPEVQRASFVPAPSRNPLLSWEPSSDPDVTYDVIVFEALPVDRPSLNRPHIPGPIIEFAKDVKSARYQLKSELKASTKYYWSVRLRKNDTVSSWSSISYRYFAFMLVATVSGSGSGIYFNFQTP